MARPLYRRSDFNRELSIEITRGEGHEPSWRSPLRRDFARLIHSAAFRRLQGKTQLFAGLESDFFRNRLTHSFEVAQIAKTIALKLNHEELEERKHRLDTDLVEFAALAHDLGHPPFGHTGEMVLDELMRDHGGFEGNAQTLRILCRLEKKLDDVRSQIGATGPIWYYEGRDAAVGLNLCSRSLASVLKYDREIPVQRSLESGLEKGYYASESPVVSRVKRDVLGSNGLTEVRVVECAIMDIADDIAYSTYDIEDAFKAGLRTPLDLLYPSDQVLEDVARRVNKELGTGLSAPDVHDVITEVFFVEPEQGPVDEWSNWYFRELGNSYSTAINSSASGFYRTAFTSTLVNSFVNAVHLELDPRHPALSRVVMDEKERIAVSVLKHLTYVLLISSSRFKLVAHRGTSVVKTIFEALLGAGGEALLPEDYRQKYQQAPEPLRLRVICDFIACMTDRYAVEFYARLSSEAFYSMFRPL